ncbi:MAG: Rad52/Rad22 family DNA repair protein [Variibacter sp.]
MSFSQRQVRALRRSVPQRFIRSRVSNGQHISYIEGWYALASANRLFGFEGWDRETVEARCVFSREARGTFHAVYVAKVRVTVRAERQSIVREGSGSGEGKSSSPAEAHDIALKGAETDATKRALVTFGKAFGLALYASGHNRSTGPTGDLSLAPKRVDPVSVRLEPRTKRAPSLLPNGFHGPAPWRKPERFIETTDRSAETQAKSQSSVSESDMEEPSRFHLKSLQHRRRNRHHLTFVAKQPCLICGRTPSDPHHLRFAQPRALGLKVSDEYTVPLCRGHHRELHRAGNEIDWWKRASIDPLPVARKLWMEKDDPGADDVFTYGVVEEPVPT